MCWWKIPCQRYSCCSSLKCPPEGVIHLIVVALWAQHGCSQLKSFKFEVGWKVATFIQAPFCLCFMQKYLYLDFSWWKRAFKILSPFPSLFCLRPDTSTQTMQSSMPAVWVKMSSSWLGLGLFLWTLVAPLLFPDRDFNWTRLFCLPFFVSATYIQCCES